MGGNFAPEQVAGIFRNEWQVWAGIRTREDLQKKAETGLKNEFGFHIPLLIKTEQEIKRIADTIPETWQNNSEQKTDVAYLFNEIDSAETVNILPVKKEFINIKYVKGAVIWNVNRENLNRSQLAKIVSHKIYQSMTVRSVNTARFLAGNI